MKKILNNNYLILENGEIYSLFTTYKGKKYSRKIPYLIRENINHKGYKFVQLTDEEGKQRKYMLSRLILRSFVGEPEHPSYQAAHLNGNKLDNRLENLKWVTPSENQLHKREHGTALIGERNHQSKLTNEDVLYIKEQLKLGTTIASLARKFKVTSRPIYEIKIGLSWTHIILERKE